MVKPLRFGFVPLLLVLALAGAPGFADDEEAAGDDPSPLAGLKEEDLEGEVERPDPIEYLDSFRDWLKKHEEPPPKTRRDTALWDIWYAALRPRATRMRRRVEKLMKRSNWLPEIGPPERVKPEVWAPFIREIAGLTAELTGAWKQYQRARIRVRRGVPASRLRPPGSYYGYAQPAVVWRRGLLTRGALVRNRVGVAGGLVVGGSATIGGVRIGGSVRLGGTARVAVRPSPLVLHSYWHLMNRYRAGWAWRIRHCYECERRRAEEQKKKFDEYIAERQRIFDSTRDTLEQQVLSLRLLAAAMQAQEESYLAEDLAEVSEDEGWLAANEAELYALSQARLRAESYDGDSAAAYGQLLRGWTRQYNKTVKRLRKAREEAERAPSDDER